MKDSRSLERLAALLDAEIAALTLLEPQRDEILGRARQDGATLIEIRALGLLLHDMYTGTERMFERVSNAFDGGVPEGASWHQDLLTSMSLEITGSRPPLIRASTAESLSEFLRFRHLLRHSYGHSLDWNRLVTLANAMPEALAHLREEVGAFTRWLRDMARIEPDHPTASQ